MQKADVVVIGAGIVGCAIALELKRERPNLRVVVIEKHEAAGQETSRLNSGVVHSGIHLPPGFLKAKLAREGSKLLIAYCQSRGIPHKKVGMYIVVPKRFIGLWTELKNFLLLIKRARAQRIPINIVSGWHLRMSEPHVSCLFAVRIPEVHIVSPADLVSSMAADAIEREAIFRFNEAVTSLSIQPESVTIVTDKEVYVADLVVNAAGLHATDVARMGGFHYCNSFYRGEYFAIKQSANISVNSLVYPVYKPGAPGLGIHLTPKMNGQTFVGPNAVKIDRKDDYTENRMTVDLFFAAVKPFLPKLKIDDLEMAFAGIRPKLAAERQENDFSINQDGRMINLIGIESPGLTASLALARLVVRSLT